MIKLLTGISTLMLSLVMMVSSVFAANSVKAMPWVYDPDNTGISEARWVTGEGLADVGKSAHAMYLTKFGTTATLAAAGASIKGEEGLTLTELGFDYRNDGHCGAGAPRFNVYTEDGYYFFGCTYGVHTPSTEDPLNWTRVRFSDADAVAATGTTPAWPGFGSVVVTDIEVVFDEGTDQGNGFIYLDNLDINGMLMGKPGNA